MEIREAREDEYAAVGDLTVAGYDADGYLTYPDGTFDENYAGWLRDAAPRGRDSVLLVAVDGDELLGTVTWCPPGSPVARARRRPTPRASSARSRSRRTPAAVASVGHWSPNASIGRTLPGLTEIVLCSLPGDEAGPPSSTSRSASSDDPSSTGRPEPDVTLWAFSAPVT